MSGNSAQLLPQRGQWSGGHLVCARFYRGHLIGNARLGCAHWIGAVGSDDKGGSQLRFVRVFDNDSHRLTILRKVPAACRTLSPHGPSWLTFFLPASSASCTSAELKSAREAL